MGKAAWVRRRGEAWNLIQPPRLTRPGPFASSGPVAAQTGATPGALELYPTLQAVGARLSYVGDTDADATARLEWRRQGGSSWNAGVAMTRITNQRWAGACCGSIPTCPARCAP